VACLSCREASITAGWKRPLAVRGKSLPWPSPRRKPLRKTAFSGAAVADFWRVDRPGPTASSLRILVFLAACGSPAAAQPPAVQPVVVARAEQVSLAAAQPFVGTVYPARTSDVGSAVDGRIVQTPVREGEHVAARQPLAELLRGLLEIERAGAAAELDRRQQELAELQAGSRSEEIARARADVAGLEAGLEYATSRFSRLERLVNRGTTTADELQDAQAALRQAEANLHSGRATLAMIEAGPRVERVAQAAAAVAAQKAEVERIDDQLSKHIIRAPFDGWVVELFTEEGQWVSRGGLVARIAELAQVEVDVQVPERHVATLREGLEVRLEFEACEEQTWIGRVARIVPQADLLSRSFPVKVLLENRVVDGQPVLRGGMLARAWLPVGRIGDAVVVPKDALVLGGTTPLVYAVDGLDSSGDTTGGSTVRPVPVTLGAATGGSVEVVGPIPAGTLVVIRGNERLRPGAPVSFNAVP
jgi:HlyD family secretion protein